MHKIAVISDTHNLLRPEVLSILEGCEAILHAGDISTPEIYDRLQNIRTIYAVRGNNDRNWVREIPLVRQFELYGLQICMTHIKRNIPKEHNADLVIYGHSHRYSCSREGDTVYLNPGSCGPRRFNQEITMAVLTLFEPDEAGGSDDFYITGSGIKMNVERIDIPHETPAGNTAEIAEKRKTNSTQKQNNLPGTAQDASAANLSRRNVPDYKKTVTTGLIRMVCYDVDHERTVDEIAERRHINPELTEQIVRMYLTHQKVTPEQIMAKLGL